MADLLMVHSVTTILPWTWRIETANGDDFSELARRALGELQAASALC
jgi:hypothetical protein